jgi:hypothetical protein
MVALENLGRQDVLHLSREGEDRRGVTGDRDLRIPHAIHLPRQM